MTYNISLRADDGILRFSLTHNQTRNKQTSSWVMQVPMGELDLFLNGRSLIEGLDYIVNFPEIVIINKEYSNYLPVRGKVPDQVVTVRFSGLCKSDLTREKFTETGYVNHGLLSNNNRYDVRDDRVIRIIVDGRLFKREQLRFSETTPGIMVPDIIDGRPYLIRDIVVPLRSVSTVDTYKLREQSKVIDKNISDFMTMKLPDQQFDMPSSITKRYQIVSPFCCKILHDLKSGIIDKSALQAFYTDNDVITLCKPYEYLLKFDPTQDNLLPDSNWVEIHPHHLFSVIELNIYAVKFLTRVIKLYLKDRVSLSHFVTMSV